MVRERCSAKTADRPRYGIATRRPLNWNDELNLPRVTMCQKWPIGTRHIFGDSAVEGVTTFQVAAEPITEDRLTGLP